MNIKKKKKREKEKERERESERDDKLGENVRLFRIFLLSLLDG